MIRILVVILALQVGAGPGISGTVRDPAGLPVSGAVVEALVDATAVSTVRTGPDGAFALPADLHVRRVSGTSASSSTTIATSFRSSPRAW